MRTRAARRNVTPPSSDSELSENEESPSLAAQLVEQMQRNQDDFRKPRTHKIVKKGQRKRQQQRAARAEKIREILEDKVHQAEMRFKRIRAYRQKEED